MKEMLYRPDSQKRGLGRTGVSRQARSTSEKAEETSDKRQRPEGPTFKKSRQLVANVWAHKKGIGNFDLHYAPKNTEWTHVFKIESLENLLKALQDNTVNRPRTMDLTYSSGPFKGQTAAGIYKFGIEDYDSMTICLSGPSAKRPTDFTSPAKSNRLLLEMTRSSDQPAGY